MNDDQNGQSESVEKPDLAMDFLSSRTRTAPVIDAEATEIPSSAAPEARAAEAPPLEEPKVQEPKLEEPKLEEPEEPKPVKSVKRKKSFSLWPVIATAVICLLGVAGYFGWTDWDSERALATRLEEALATRLAPILAMVTPHNSSAVVSTVESPAKDPGVESATEKAVAEVTARLAVTQAALEQVTGRLQALEAKPVEAKPVEAKTIEAPSDPLKTSAFEQAAERAVAEVTARLATTQAALEQVTERLHAVESRPVETAAPEARSAETPAHDPAAEQAVAEVTSRLAATQAALAQVTERLQSVEGQLTAPKTEARALLGEREAGPAKGGDVSARIVASQSLLAAIRQGDDYAPMLAALQNLGGNPDRVARLRAGLTAPGASALARDFVALAPKILAATAPAPQPQLQQAKEPQNFGETILAYLKTHAEKWVRINPDGFANSESANRVARIEKDLTRGDLASALAERAQLPAPALALTADWAASAQARLDAELAAKAELDAALQSLSKNRS